MMNETADEKKSRVESSQFKVSIGQINQEQKTHQKAQTTKHVACCFP